MTTSKGDRLDAIFAELNPINQEIRKIGWTPSGRLRYRLSPEQEARLEELTARSNELASKAARIVSTTKAVPRS